MSGFKIIDGGNIVVNGLVIALYGDAGVGKTTTALTAKKPLLLDFDGGVQRCDLRGGKDIVTIRDWEADILPALKDIIANLSSYSTIIIDTADSCINAIKTWVKLRRPKDCIDGRKMYGLIKDEFYMFINTLVSAGIDIILIAHKTTEEENKIKRSVMQITGGSKNLIYQRADFMGYIHIDGKSRAISFIPTEEWDGKTVSNYNSNYFLPDCFTNSNFFELEIQKMKDAINSRATKQVEKANFLIAQSELISKAMNATDMNLILEDFNGSTEPTAIKKQLWAKMKERAKEVNIIFDADNKIFVLPAPPPPPVVKEPEAVTPEPEKKNGNGTAKPVVLEPEKISEEKFSFD